MADATQPKPTDANEDVKPAAAPVDGNLPIDPNRDIHAGVNPQRTRTHVGPQEPKPAQPEKQEPEKQEPAKTPQTESEQPEPPAGPPPERED